jgi:hypothetical protein
MKLNETSLTIEDVELHIKFYYTPGLPAVINDIPENCHPEDYPEVEIETVCVSGTDVDISSLLSHLIIDKIETKILETADADYD